MLQAKHPIVYVSDSAHLSTLCDSWKEQSILALDTEFMRTTTFFPQPALVQLNDGQTNFLIDVLGVDDWQPLREVMADTSIRKILHSCSEDLEVFHRLLGEVPTNLFDTQIAAAFVGMGYSLGYSGLVDQLLGVQLPKDETRSDWLQRPLSASQCQYAAMDVEFLYQAGQLLLSKLHELDRLIWVEDECHALVSSYLASQEPGSAIQRFRGAWRLNSRQLALLQRLAEWRERVARQRDRPRNHILRDKALYKIAETLPHHVAQIRKAADLPEKAIRRYGEQLMDLVNEVNALPDDQLPARLQRNPTASQQSTIKHLREKLADVAKQHSLAPELISRKKDCEFLVRAAEGLDPEQIGLPPGIARWRADLIKPVVEQYLWNLKRP